MKASLKLLGLMLLAVFACGQPAAPADAGAPATPDVAPPSPSDEEGFQPRRPRPASTFVAGAPIRGATSRSRRPHVQQPMDRGAARARSVDVCCD